MSLDYLFKYLWPGNYFEKFPDPQGKELPMERHFEHLEKSRELLVILPFWSSGRMVTRFLSWRGRRSGKDCLSYYFSPELLSSDPEYTLQGFRKIRAMVRKDIAELKKQFGYSRVKVVASSLGAISAMLVANGNEDVDELALIVPGSCFASSLWDGIQTQKLKQIYEAKMISLNSLQGLWKELDPKNNLDRLEDKNIFISISKADRLIPYPYGRELADLLAEKGAQVAENRFWGHYLSIANFYLFGKL